MSWLLVIIMFVSLYLFFFNDTATTEIYTLSLHDALPISSLDPVVEPFDPVQVVEVPKERAVLAVDLQRVERLVAARVAGDRKSTRLNSSHANISYAVFCLKKKKITYVHLCTSIIKNHLYI